MKIYSHDSIPFARSTFRHGFSTARIFSFYNPPVSGVFEVRTKNFLSSAKLWPKGKGQLQCAPPGAEKPTGRKPGRSCRLFPSARRPPRPPGLFPSSASARPPAGSRRWKNFSPRCRRTAASGLSWSRTSIPATPACCRSCWANARGCACGWRRTAWPWSRTRFTFRCRKATSRSCTARCT